MKVTIKPKDQKVFQPFQVIIDVNNSTEATTLDDIFYFAAQNCRSAESKMMADDFRSMITSHVNKMK